MNIVHMIVLWSVELEIKKNFLFQTSSKSTIKVNYFIIYHEMSIFFVELERNVSDMTRQLIQKMNSVHMIIVNINHDRAKFIMIYWLIHNTSRLPPFSMFTSRTIAPEYRGNVRIEIEINIRKWPTIGGPGKT